MNIVKLLDFVLFIVTSYVIIYMIFTLTKRIRNKQIEKITESTIFLPGKKNKSQIIYKLYLFFSNWTLTRTYIKRIESQFMQISINKKRDNAEKTMKTTLKIWVMNIIICILMFALKPNLNNAIITIAYLVFVNNETIVRTYRKLYLRLLIQFNKWLGDFIQSYHGKNGILQSLHNTINQTPSPLREHINTICKILEADDIEEESLKYLSIIPNRFLKMFLTTTIVTFKYGDSLIDNKSLYLSNIGIMQQELNNEILSMRRKDLIINSAIPIIMIPMGGLGLIRYWGANTFPELNSYYESGTGILLVLSIVLITLGLYEYFNFKRDELKVINKNFKFINSIIKIPFINNMLENLLEKNNKSTSKMERFLKSIGEKITVKQLLIKRIIFSFMTILIAIFLINIMHFSNKNIFLNDMSGVSFDSTINTKDSEIVKDIILEYVSIYKDSNVTQEELEELLLQKHIRNKIIATMTAKEIIQRVQSYQNEYFKWYELAIAILISCASFYIPVWNLHRQKDLSRRKMLNETNQFNSIILMLMHVENMSKDVILYWLEMYSDIFKVSIRKCITELNTGEMDAFENLKKREPFTPFVRIVECLENTDKLYIKDAFSTVPEERNKYMESSKLDDEIYLRHVTSRVNMLSLVPLGTVIYLYLVLPLLIETLYKNSITESLMNMLMNNNIK